MGLNRQPQRTGRLFGTTMDQTMGSHAMPYGTPQPMQQMPQPDQPMTRTDLFNQNPQMHSGMVGGLAAGMGANPMQRPGMAVVNRRNAMGENQPQQNFRGTWR